MISNIIVLLYASSSPAEWAPNENWWSQATKNNQLDDQNLKLYETDCLAFRANSKQ